MTCVVARPGVLVTDSRETGEIKSARPKHFRVNGYLVGVAGDVGTWQAAQYAVAWPRQPSERAFVRWLHRLHDDEKLNFDEVSFLVVTATEVYTLDGRAVTRGVAGAIGSGAAYALGYLRGCPDDLEGAVGAACYYDPYCAGPVVNVRL